MPASVEARIAAIPSATETLSDMPTFARFVEQPDEVSAPLHALRVVVLTAARTYSAGFDIATMLVKHGASVIGTPSAQSGNCFIDALRFTLINSRLNGSISYKRSLMFPDDAEVGSLLRPDVELTYQQLVTMNFDPNAAVRLAREYLEHI